MVLTKTQSLFDAPVRRRQYSLMLLAVLAIVGFGSFVLATSWSKTEVSLDNAIAAAIIQEQEAQAREGYASPEGALVVKIEAGLVSDPYRWIEQPAVAIWKYQSGRLTGAMPEAIDAARQNKNVLIFVYVIRESTRADALADVATYYPMSTTPGFSNGGNASHWRLQHTNSAWHLASRNDFAFWD